MCLQRAPWSGSGIGGELVEDVLDGILHGLVAVVVLVEQPGGPTPPYQALVLGVQHIEHQGALVAGLHIRSCRESQRAVAMREGIYEAEAEGGAGALQG